MDRILKEDGVLTELSILLICDVIWQPSVNYEDERTYCELFDKVNINTEKLGEQIAYRWDKRKLLSHVEECGFFNYVKASNNYRCEKFNKEKLIGIALSQGGL